MSDEIEKLKADWQRQNTGIAELRGRLDLLNLQGRRQLAAAVMATGVGIAAGIGYAVAAWLTRDVVFALAAFVMLVLYPWQVIPALRLNRRMLVFPDRTPEGTLRYAVTRLTLNMRLLRNGYLVVAMFAGLAVAIGIAAAAGLTRPYPPVVVPILTGTFLLCAFIVTLTTRWQLRRVRRELAAGERMLAEFLAAQQADLAGENPQSPPPGGAS
jgi:hypothetical protein